MNTIRSMAGRISSRSLSGAKRRVPGSLLKAFLCVWLVAGLLLACGPGAALAASLTVKDSLGRSVEIALPVQRIVCLNSDTLEVMRTLKAEDRIVGVFSEMVRESEFWGGLTGRPKVGSWRDPDIEAIAALKPDLVIAYSWNPGSLLERQMAPFDIQVLRLDLYKAASLEKEVQVLGRLLQREKEAARFCDWHRQRLGAIRERIAGISRRPAVYLESYSDYHAAGPNSGGHEMCVAAGGRNITADLAIPYPRVTAEWVVSQNPEVIVKAASYGNGYSLKNAAPFNRRREALLQRPAWGHITAVASGNVHVMDSSIWTGPRAVVGITYLAQWFYPGLFADLDPEAVHKEYLETFQGIAHHGVFVSDDRSGAGR